MPKLGILLLGLALQSCTIEGSDDTGSLGGAFVPGSDESAGITFPVVMSPACATAGLFATGSATVDLSDDSSRIVVSGIRYAALSTAVTGAHFHQGAAPGPGPIIFNLGDTASTISFTDDDYPSSVPGDGPASFTAFVDEMLAGNTYVDIHTEACADGEIRGQLR